MLSRIVFALCIASLAAMAPVYVFAMLRGANSQDAPVMALATGVTALASGLLSVPALVFVPRLRRPHVAIAAVWGASVASVIAAVLVSRDMNWHFIAFYAMVGAASGVVYAAAARMLSMPDF